MDREIEALHKHQTWTLMPRSAVPKGRKPTKSKWVYAIKYKADGTVDKFKSRFVVCGYSQVAGIDYDQSFSSTLRATSFRMLLALAAHNRMQLEHVDVSSAFTQAELDEVDIWVEPPKGYASVDPDGSPQAHRSWNKRG